MYYQEIDKFFSNIYLSLLQKRLKTQILYDQIRAHEKKKSSDYLRFKFDTILKYNMFDTGLKQIYNQYESSTKKERLNRKNLASRKKSKRHLN